MATQPDLTFRSNIAPYSTLSSVVYQTTFYGLILPVLSKEPSDSLYFRIYNNWALNSNIASALNMRIYVQDGISTATYSTSPISQLWYHVAENMFGESVGASYNRFTTYIGMDTCIGNSSNYYPIERGSDGSQAGTLRAGSNKSGVGFIEIKSYATLPTGVTARLYTPAIVVSYQWNT